MTKPDEAKIPYQGQDLEKTQAIHRDYLKMPVMAPDGSPSSAEGSL